MFSRDTIFFYLASSQGQGHHNSVSQLLWARITWPTQSTFPVGGNRSTRRKPMTFSRALTILFSHDDWDQIHIKIEPGTLEVKGEWSDHYTTKAPVIFGWGWPNRFSACWGSETSLSIRPYERIRPDTKVTISPVSSVHNLDWALIGLLE